MRNVLLIFFFVFFTQFISGQKVDLKSQWPAAWICDKDGPARDFGIFYFRKAFELREKPDTFVIHTSADNRYQLFVNEQLVTCGPLRDDIDHWKYESTDISKFLTKGKNVIAAVVWNWGAYQPDAQFSVTTAFLLLADDKKNSYVNSNESWRVLQDKSYSQIPPDKTQISGYYGAGANERVDGNRFLWHWYKKDYDDTNWNRPINFENAKPRTCIWAGKWKLTPRSLPLEKLFVQRFRRVRIAEGANIPASFPQIPCDVTIPSNTTARIVLDQGFETTAFPEMEVSGGKNSLIRLKYVEAPYSVPRPDANSKANRNEINGKYFLGLYDEYIADGGSNRIYKPLWWRAFRYIELTIITKDEPLVINDFRGIHTGYPFEQKSEFRISGNQIDTASIRKIIETGDRTLRACSHETFMDCPYYEQTQFVGDGRVEMLVSYYNYGDPLLAKNGITQFYHSLNSEGFMSARYPANSTYFIPNFSIYWIGMLYDYMMHFDDRSFVQQNIPGVRTILKYFLDRKREDGTIRRPDYHNYVDWTFPNGESPSDEKGYSALVDLHVLLALTWAEEIEKYAGSDDFAKMYSKEKLQLSQVIKNKYWKPESGLFSDIPDGKKYSQHTNSLAILCNLVSGADAQNLMKKTLEDRTLTQASIYFRFYLFEALCKSGLGNDYISHLDTWKEMLNAGVTTWPETGLVSRSECHGWGSSPNYHLLKIIMGITPSSPGFKSVHIEPCMANATNMAGAVPHYKGLIRVKYNKTGQNGLDAEVELPEGLIGDLVWNGSVKLLKPGKQIIKF